MLQRLLRYPPVEEMSTLAKLVKEQKGMNTSIENISIELIETNPLLRRIVLGESDSQSPDQDKKKKTATWIPTPTHVLSHKIQKPRDELEEKKVTVPAEGQVVSPPKQFDPAMYSNAFRKGVMLPPGVKSKGKEKFRETQARDLIEPFHVKMTYVMRTLEDLVNVLQMEDYL